MLCKEVIAASHVLPLQQRTMSLTQSVWCSIEAMYGSCCNRVQKLEIKHPPPHHHHIPRTTLQQMRCHNCGAANMKEVYFVLVDTPYPDDWVSSSSEEPIESGVQLQRIHPIPVVFFHLVPNHIGHLIQKETSARSHQTLITITRIVPSNTPTSLCTFRNLDTLTVKFHALALKYYEEQHDRG